MRSVLLRIAGITLMCLAGSAAAGIEVHPLFIDVSRTDGAIRVSNSGAETAYVEAEIFEVFDARRPTQREARVDDPRQAGLLLAPRRLTLAPGDVRRIRLLNLGHPPADRVFKVKVSPRVGQAQSSSEVAVKVLVGYGVWVFSRPDGGRPQLRIRRDGRLLTLENDGSSFAELSVGRYCEAGGRCETIALPRVFVGGVERVELPSATGTLRFTVQPGGERIEL